MALWQMNSLQRVHNSGHWTLNGAITSQFENHIRAVSGLPLGSTAAQGVAVMKNIIGEALEAKKVLSDGSIHYYDYRKEPRAGRKIGHLTFLAETQEEAAKKLAAQPWK